jgi:hypothetical protein
MDALGAARHRSIERLVSQSRARAFETLVTLWNPLATQIIAIVGAGGFDSLYARSVYLTQLRFSWLAADCDTPTEDSGFANLTTSLDSATPELAHAANCLLLITFTDLFASLVGEPLTVRVLDSAWGTDASEPVEKDKNNE